MTASSRVNRPRSECLTIDAQPRRGRLVTVSRLSRVLSVALSLPRFVSCSKCCCASTYSACSTNNPLFPHLAFPYIRGAMVRGGIRSPSSGPRRNGISIFRCRSSPLPRNQSICSRFSNRWAPKVFLHPPLTPPSNGTPEALPGLKTRHEPTLPRAERTGPAQIVPAPSTWSEEKWEIDLSPPKFTIAAETVDLEPIFRSLGVTGTESPPNKSKNPIGRIIDL